MGPGGHFLKQRNTRNAARSKEFYTPRLIDRSPYEAWLGLGQPSMYARAREEVRRILAEPLADPLPEEVEARLGEILETGGSGDRVRKNLFHRLRRLAQIFKGKTLTTKERGTRRFFKGKT